MGAKNILRLTQLVLIFLLVCTIKNRMILFRFEIDKETCFVYFVQSLIKWGWYFEEKNKDYFLKITGTLTSEEEKALTKLGKILQKEDNYFFWLWDRYNGAEIKDEKEKEEWKEIKKKLEPRFEQFWSAEKEKLKKWQNSLEKYPFDKFRGELEKISQSFFEIEYSFEEVIVKLIFNGEKDFPMGHVKNEFENLMLLGLSSLDFNEENKKRTINTLFHELIHKIAQKSENFYSIINGSCEKIIAPSNIKLERDHKWKYLMEEALLKTIASRRFNNYLGRKLTKDELLIESDKVKTIDLENNKSNYGYLIRIIAGKVENKVAEYIENDKPFDEKISNYIAREWVSLLKE